jgi:hypothetical protein
MDQGAQHGAVILFCSTPDRLLPSIIRKFLKNPQPDTLGIAAASDATGGDVGEMGIRPCRFKGCDGKYFRHVFQRLTPFGLFLSRTCRGVARFYFAVVVPISRCAAL